LRALTPIERAKFQRLAEEAVAYDTLFVGSSHVLRGIDPRVVDRTMREEGIETDTYVYALKGMLFPRLTYEVERILALELPRLRTLVIEPRWGDGEFAEGDQRANKGFVGSHDWKRTRICVTAALLSDEPLPSRLDRVLNLLQIFLRNRVALGLGREWLAELAGEEVVDPDDAAEAGEEEIRGYRPLRVEENRGRNARFAAMRPDYEAAVERYRRAVRRVESRTPDDPQMSFKKSRVHALVDRIADAGIVPVVLVFPSVTEWMHYFDRTWVEERGGVVLAFDDPDAHPAPYAAAWHIDFRHFNAEGAAGFSELVSRALAAELRTRTP
jgi:hypothetical protein